MKKVFKVLGIIVLVLVVGITGLLAYVKLGLPNTGEAPKLTIERTPERIARGKYLAHSVTVCMDCHSKRDWSQFAGPMVPGTLGMGGEKFGKEVGMPGTIYSRNITPYGIGNWTDGELYRCITTGVTKDGRALFPLMPYSSYGKMDDEDIYSIIAYIRTLPSIKNEIPERELDFPLNFIVNTIPTKATPGKQPTADFTVEYGKYLTTSAACVECHTPFEKGQLVAGMEFAGGRAFILPGGTVNSANITPDPSGIGSWTKADFVKRFKQYADTNYHSPQLLATDNNSIMPWMMYSRMDDRDLEAIYEYLNTLKPIDHPVKKYEPVATL